MRRWLPAALAILGACAEPEPTRPLAAVPPLAAERPLRLVRDDPSDLPIHGISDAELARFREGDARFELPFREAQGLGPHFVHRSCTSCHEDDARGPGAVRRIVAEPGVALPHGDVVRPRLAAGATTPVLAPEGAREVVRFPLAVFARGYLEAIPDETLLAWEAAQAAAGEVSGRAARLAPRELEPACALGERAPRLGRFGHKARSATLESFVADALLGDMSLTSPARPDEPPSPDELVDDLHAGIDVSDETVALLADYVRLLAIPERGQPDARGALVFEEVGCAACHVPRARTRSDHPVAALRDVEVALYTDLLLHDMGEELADGVPEGVASASEWRTPPLVGIRFLRGLLHDARAEDVEAAIAAHGGEAGGSVARLAQLGPDDRRHLVAFVEAL